MTATATPLPGMPEPPVAVTPRRRSEDYETWVAEVWPHFVTAAGTGRVFTCFEIAKNADLPEPPDGAHHWGRLMTLLKEEGFIKTAGWANSDRPTSNHSGVRTWRGTRAAVNGRAA